MIGSPMFGSGRAFRPLTAGSPGQAGAGQRPYYPFHATAAAGVGLPTRARAALTGEPGRADGEVG